MNNEIPVKVRLKIGSIEVELECPQKDLEKTIKNVISAIENNIEKKGITIEKEEVKNEVIQKRKISDNLTCRDLIEAIYKEGWFSEERSLSSVVEEIARRGYNYNSTAVSHVLLDLVRQGILERKGKPRNYRYVSKISKKEESITSNSKKIEEVEINNISIKNSIV
jgi:predicted transcriptional regulator